MQVLVPLGTRSATSSVSRFASADDWKPETYDGDGSTGCLLHSLRSWRFHTGQPFSANLQVSPGLGFLSVTLVKFEDPVVSQQQILKFPKSHWCQNLMSQIRWKTLMLGRFSNGISHSESLNVIWNGGRIAWKYCSHFRHVSIEKGTFSVANQQNSDPFRQETSNDCTGISTICTPDPILNHEGIWAEIRLRIQDAESPACPSNMALLFASYLCWVSFFGGEV